QQNGPLIGNRFPEARTPDKPFAVALRMRRKSLNRSPVGLVGNSVAHPCSCADAALSRSSSSKVGVFMRRIIRRTSLAVALLVSLATLVTLVASPSWANSRHHHHHGD